MEDISPYTCIVEGCEQKHELFVTRAKWMKHILGHSPQYWRCQACSLPNKPPREFSSKELYLSHLREAYWKTISEYMYHDLAKDAARSGPTGISQCPLCNVDEPSDSGALFDHISRHIRSFSLLSLPLSHARLWA